MRDPKDIANQFCTPLPGNGPLAACFENVVVAVQVAQQEALEAALKTLATLSIGPEVTDETKATIKQAFTQIAGMLPEIPEADG